LRWSDDELARLDAIPLDIPEPPAWADAGRRRRGALHRPGRSRQVPPSDDARHDNVLVLRREVVASAGRNDPALDIPAVAVRAHAQLVRGAAAVRRQGQRLAAYFNVRSLRTRIAVFVPALGAVAVLVAIVGLAVRPKPATPGPIEPPGTTSPAAGVAERAGMDFPPAR
jgi:hypothetical protein